MKSKLEELIEKLCPNGVEYKELGKLGEFYGGITGKTKKDFSNGNSKFITYKNVYTNLALKVDVEDKVYISENENQRTLEYGDIIFTGSSETVNECGITSVLTVKTNEKLYLNSFCFFFRFTDKTIMLPEFSKYLFHSSEIRKKIIKTASGVTRFNISKKLMANIEIPLPPLEIQEEIVRILDKFTELTTEIQTELATELTLRKQQYEYYRDKLLSEEYLIKNSFNNIVLKKTTLGEIGEFVRGNGLQKKDFREKGKPVIHYGEIYTKYGFSTEKTISFTEEEIYNKLRKAKKNDILMATTSENVEDVGKCVVWRGKEEIGFSGDMYKFTTEENSKYIAYYFQTEFFQRQKRHKVTGTKVIRIHADDMKKFEIILPTIEIQNRVVEVLDKFQKLINETKGLLPEEIEERKKQYKYYREKLLTFEEKCDRTNERTNERTNTNPNY